MSQREPVRIGVVGLNFGRHILDQLGKSPAAEHLRLVAVCDLDRDKADRLAAAHGGVRACYSLDELLAMPEIEAVGLFTGPVGRAELIRRILATGRDVLTTKPFERDPEAGLAVLREARAMGRVVHLNSPGPLLTDELARIQEWRARFGLGRPVACRRDVWVSYREKPTGTWYDDPRTCPVAPVFRLGIYLINDLVRLFGEAQRVTVLGNRLFTERPTADNGQLGILFRNGVLANIYASFCVKDGDHYRNSMVLNFENGTVYLNAGPTRDSTAPNTAELSLVQVVGESRQVVASDRLGQASGEYQWEAFARAVRGETLVGEVTPEEVAAGLRVIDAMSRAELGTGVADVG